jgi:hypothetical protein
MIGCEQVDKDKWYTIRVKPKPHYIKSINIFDNFHINLGHLKLQVILYSNEIVFKKNDKEKNYFRLLYANHYKVVDSKIRSSSILDSDTIVDNINNLKINGLKPPLTKDHHDFDVGKLDLKKNGNQYRLSFNIPRSIKYRIIYNDTDDYFNEKYIIKNTIISLFDVNYKLPRIKEMIAKFERFNKNPLVIREGAEVSERIT